MDVSMKLKERQEAYTRELAVNQAELQTKMNDLERARVSLKSCVSDKDRIKAEEQVLEEQVRQLDGSIDNVKKNIGELTYLIVLSQKELSGVSVFSFGRKKELKAKIEAAERKLSQEKGELNKLLLDRSRLKKERKSGLLESLEDRVAEQEKLIIALEKEVAEIECDVERIHGKLSGIDLAIQTHIEESRKTEEIRLMEKDRKAGGVQITGETRRVEAVPLAELKKKKEELAVSAEAKNNKYPVEAEIQTKSPSEEISAANEIRLKKDLFHAVSLFGKEKRAEAPKANQVTLGEGNVVKTVANVVYEEQSTLSNEIAKTKILSLYETILLLRSEEECWNFFGELLGPMEYQKLEQRAQIAKLLDYNATYNEVHQKTGASTATIRRVSAVLSMDDEFRSDIIKNRDRKDKSPREYFSGLVIDFINVEDCKHFFSCLCSPVECRAMELRFSIALHLYQGKTYVQVTAETGASSATIGRLKNVIDNDYSLIRNVFKRAKVSENIVDSEAGVAESDGITPIGNEATESVRPEITMLHYQLADIDAVGYEDKEFGFVLKKGSRVCVREHITCGATTRRLRKEYAGLVSDTGILQEDIVFKSANEAADFCTFGTSNSTLIWKDKSDTSLIDLRKNDEIAEGLGLVEEERKAGEVRFIEEGGKVEEVCLTEESGIVKKEQIMEVGKKDVQIQVIESTKSRVRLIDSYAFDERPTDIPYYKLYGINPADFMDIKIEGLGFSARLDNRVKGYETVGRLLTVNDDTLREINGFGKGCFEELHSYFSAINTNAVSERVKEDKKGRIIELTEELIPYKKQLLYGDFSFLDGMMVSHRSQIIIDKFKEAHEILDFEFVENIVDGMPEVFAIMKMLRNFVKRFESGKIVESIIKEIPFQRLETKVSLVIKCFTDNESVLQYLQGFVADDNQTLRIFLQRNAEKIYKNDPCFNHLVSWCKYNLDSEVNHFFVEQIKNDRELQVIRQRAERKTLDEVGKTMDVTRERIRQIESKVRRRFGTWQKQQRIIFKIFLDMGEETGLSSLEIINFLGTYGKEFVYLMKECGTEEINYDKQLDMFVIEDLPLTEKIQTYVESLPDAFPERKLAEFLQVAEKENEYPEKMVLAVIGDSYRKTGDTYHRCRLTLTVIYGDVMKKYYSSGIHVYDADEIEKFRQHVMDDYGIDISSKSDHAIGSILVRIGILCGRGIYKLREKKTYISKELAKRIHDYIEESNAPVFMTNTLFSIFEEELMAEGIDNKYFLQGILRELYENDWIFRRDYISKDESYTSVYSSIVGYIRNSKYPVSKEDLYREFPGITEIVINFSVSDPNILNLFGMYIHSCRLRLTDTDLKYLRDTVEQFLDNKKVCHCREIYDYINADYPELLTNNFVQYAFSFYSLIEYLFRDHYNFSRPYVAKENAKIERALDVLKDIVKESERMDISEIQAFAREHSVQIYSIREFIDSCNDTHLLINDLEVASIEYTGVTERIAKDLEARIIAEIDTTVPIHQLQCIHSLPNVNVEWNAWLIYSVLNKWSTLLAVGASASQFRQSYPVVAPVGKLDTTVIAEVDGGHEGKIVMADDLSKIDDLVCDFILDDLEDLNGL